MSIDKSSPWLGNQPEPFACQGPNAGLFFAEHPADVETAKALCRPCPIRGECLGGAVSRGEPWGVWGGELLLNGVVVPGKRPRGRPRKNGGTNAPVTTRVPRCRR